MSKKGFIGFLSDLRINPVLIDIGASGSPPAVWDAIAKQSIYVGFDPDLREVHVEEDKQYRKYIMVNRAVASNPEDQEVTFYFTKNPFCSSTLRPNDSALENYLYRNYFIVNDDKIVPAQTLDNILDSLSLTHVDWIKTDTQGTDLRIFQSISSKRKNMLLAFDVEPGLADAYLGEDMFVETHNAVVQEGFWLASLHLQKAVRMRQSTLKDVMGVSDDKGTEYYHYVLEGSPSACDARYLRTLEYMIDNNFDSKQYALSWVFAMLAGQQGYALDVVVEYKNRVGEDEYYEYMLSNTLKEIKRAKLYRSILAKVKMNLPYRMKHIIKEKILSRVGG